MKLSTVSAAILSVFVVLCATGFVNAETIKIYVAPNGDDNNSGENPKQSLKTISQVQENIKKNASLKPGDSVEILFKKGVYFGQSLIWNPELDNVNFYFKPASEEDNPVIFDGKKSKFSNFFTIRFEDDKYKNKKISTNLHFDRITVRNYCMAISFGDADNKAFIMNNSVTNSTFSNIGSRYDPVYRKVNNVERPKGACVAAIRTNKALSTIIKNNRFYKILNLPSNKTSSKKYGPTLLHAIYISQHSSNTRIQNNNFDTFSGTPIRIRNQSNNTKIINNTFKNPAVGDTKKVLNESKSAKGMEAISQWYCNDAVEKCVELSRTNECLSTGIEILGNKFGAGLIPYANLAQNHKCLHKNPSLNKALNTSDEVILEN